MSEDKNGACKPAMNGMNLIARHSIKALVALVAIGVV